MPQPLESGHRYRNSYGEYELVSIDGMWATVRYDSGQVKRHLLAALEIHQRNADRNLAAQSAAAPPKAARARQTSPRAPRAYSPLRPDDFKLNINGTTWRRREGFGGQVAQQLHDRTGRDFRSHAVFQRPQVLYGQPPRFDPSDTDKFNFRRAKFEVRLDDETLSYGFYIEKSDQAMDSTWEWPAFLAALGRADVTGPLAAALNVHALSWEIARSRGSDLLETRAITAGDPLFANGAPLWDALADELATTPANEWLDVRLRAVVPRDEALGQGLNLASTVVAAFQALLPLYDACARP